MALLTDGYQCSIAFAEDSDVQMEVIDLTLPGIDGGGVIDQTTMTNTTYRTAVPKSLVSITDSTLTVAYDGDFIDEVISMINTNQQITITLSDTSTYVFWGSLGSFTPGTFTEGERPTATVTLNVTNRNAAGTETGPVYTGA